MRCDRCEIDAVIDQPYRAGHLCERHFRESVRERVRREMHRQLPRFPGGTVAVALSGGKDSSVALKLTHAYLARRPNVRLIAISVDEGIAGYRTRTLDAAAHLCEELAIEHRVVRAAEQLGTTTDEASRRLAPTPPCSYCGVWRRSLLNRTARDVGASTLVLGFNLDDLAQTVLMNVARADLARLVRMAPHRDRQPGMVPRIAPLASIPEREVLLYARLAKVPFDHAECPHAGPAARNVFREVVWQLEEALPGTRHALVRTQQRLRDLLVGTDLGEDGPQRCADCGEPSTGPRCRACEYRALALTPLMRATG